MIDPRRHFLLGEPPRADGEQHGECAWTLLGQTMWAALGDIADRCYTTRLERMPLPSWWGNTGFQADADECA